MQRQILFIYSGGDDGYHDDLSLRARAYYFSIGSEKKNVLPVPTSLSAQICPL